MRHRWALLEHGSRFPHSTPVKEISLPLRAGEIQDVRDARHSWQLLRHAVSLARTYAFQLAASKRECSSMHHKHNKHLEKLNACVHLPKWCEFEEASQQSDAALHQPGRH